MAEPSDGFAHIYQASLKIPPTLTKGKITPQVLHRWERGCLNYFRHKKIKKTDQVEDILFKIKDLRLSCWINANESDLKEKSFADFMADLRGEALGSNWARSLRTEIFRTRQDGRVFFDWVCETESKNAMLVPVPSAHISNERLRDHFEANMNYALSQRCQRNSIISITDYREWTKAVKQEDELLQQYLENLRSASLNIIATKKARNSSSSSSTSTASTPNPSAVFRLPKLSEKEKKIFTDHDGCFKCRHPYAGHRSLKCPNGFPQQ